MLSLLHKTYYLYFLQIAHSLIQCIVHNNLALMIVVHNFLAKLLTFNLIPEKNIHPLKLNVRTSVHMLISLSLLLVILYSGGITIIKPVKMLGRNQPVRMDDLQGPVKDHHHTHQLGPNLDRENIVIVYKIFMFYHYTQDYGSRNLKIKPRPGSSLKIIKNLIM